MLKIVERIKRGQGRLEDLSILEEVADKIGIMPGTTICGLADGAGWPVKTAIRKYRDEFKAYLREGTPTGGTSSGMRLSMAAGH
jgi:NADH-quinone oxidoreductase subunit F